MLTKIHTSENRQMFSIQSETNCIFCFSWCNNMHRVTLTNILYFQLNIWSPTNSKSIDYHSCQQWHTQITSSQTIGIVHKILIEQCCLGFYCLGSYWIECSSFLRFHRRDFLTGNRLMTRIFYPWTTSNTLDPDSSIYIAHA